jgi:hypothetical protein
MAIPLGRPLPNASRDRPGRRRGNPPGDHRPPCRPYLVLLPVGFTLPRRLPAVRCALTAPFHPCRQAQSPGRRFAFCGTFPGVAPAGCYPAPCFRGARTFLPPCRNRRKGRPSGHLPGMRVAGAGGESRPAAAETLWCRNRSMLREFMVVQKGVCARHAACGRKETTRGCLAQRP